ncbi:hypothetical protein M0804_008223 [Polistes exclamans]|nr:hypothetical protein M0804_008223 [Polistes exclamans]
MGVRDVDQAKRRLQDILRKAQKLEIPAQEVISTRTAQKLLARTKNVVAWTIWIGVFIILLSFLVYTRWPTRQEVETVRTVLRRTCVWDKDNLDVNVLVYIYYMFNELNLKAFFITNELSMYEKNVQKTNSGSGGGGGSGGDDGGEIGRISSSFITNVYYDLNLTNFQHYYHNRR